MAKILTVSPDVNIFSGDYSRAMWEEINNAKTVADLRNALYFVCCRLQEFESSERESARQLAVKRTKGARAKRG